MMCQFRFNCKNRTTLVIDVDDEGGCACAGAEVI